MDHQAFAQLLGNYGEFIGAIAVVGTLIYLAVQVRHSKVALHANTRALDETVRQARADAVRETIQRWDELFRHATGTREAASIFVRGNRDLSDLDEVDQVIYTSQMIPFMNHLLYVMQLAQDDYLGDEVVGEDIPELLDILIGDLLRNQPGAKTWWDNVQFSWPHRDYVNALLAKGGEADRWTIGTAIAAPGPARANS